MIYVFVWTKTDEHAFERSVPLLWHGEYLRKMGWSNEITLVFLEGLNVLSKNYRRKLEILGYQILDCHMVVNNIITHNYPQMKHFRQTSKFWFLRWNVLYHLIQEGIAPQNVIHLDGDVIFMNDPHKIQQDVAGKTFVLEGCPAFTSLSREDWFQVWQKELTLFLENRKRYEFTALAEKEEPTRPSREFCSIYCYEHGRFEDQDMLQFLISAGRLPQARTEEIFNSSFYWVQNPLFPDEWFVEQKCGSVKKIVEKEGASFVGQKQVAFYHFQSNFTIYCHHWMLLHKMGLDWLTRTTKNNVTTRRVSLQGRVIGRMVRLLNHQKTISRREIYEMVFQKNPKSGNLYITDIVNSCW